MSKSPSVRARESVWDYPRPPRVEPAGRHIRIEFDGEVLVDSSRAFRVLETSHPPVYYVPRDDVRQDCLQASDATSFCEWKGRARYFDLATAAPSRRMRSTLGAWRATSTAPM